MNNELKPCPFCGGRAEYNEDNHGWHWIECTKCESATGQVNPLTSGMKSRLAESWNTRAEPEQPVGVDKQEVAKQVLSELLKALEGDVFIDYGEELDLDSHNISMRWVRNEINRLMNDWPEFYSVEPLTHNSDKPVNPDHVIYLTVNSATGELTDNQLIQDGLNADDVDMGKYPLVDGYEYAPFTVVPLNNSDKGEEIEHVENYIFSDDVIEDAVTPCDYEKCLLEIASCVCKTKTKNCRCVSCLARIRLMEITQPQ